jgi:hypothetical protein
MLRRGGFFSGGLLALLWWPLPLGEEEQGGTGERGREYGVGLAFTCVRAHDMEALARHGRHAVARV